MDTLNFFSRWRKNTALMSKLWPTFFSVGGGFERGGFRGYGGGFGGGLGGFGGW
jgi:hypothetical protein